MALAVVTFLVAIVASLALWGSVFDRYYARESASPQFIGASPSNNHARGGGGSTTPAQRPTPGITARSTISASGSLRTDTHVGFRHPVSALSFSVPTTGATSASAGFDPQISDLQVAVDGRRIPDVPQTLSSGRVVQVHLPAGTMSVEVTYAATGVISKSPNSNVGRALVLATPLRISAPSTLPATIMLQGGHILNLGCWPPHSAPEACGEQTSDGWKVHTEAPTGAVGVVAQIDLAV